MQGLMICGPGRSMDRRKVKYCPVEKRRRRMVVTYGGFWGHDVRCCGCGNHWMDGELLTNPKAKGTANNIPRFKNMWVNTPSAPDPTICEEMGYHLNGCDCE